MGRKMQLPAAERLASNARPALVTPTSGFAPPRPPMLGNGTCKVATATQDADEPALELQLRTLGLRSRRIVRGRQCAAAAASHADVRPHLRDCRGGRGIRQGAGASRARSE